MTGSFDLFLSARLAFLSGPMATAELVGEVRLARSQTGKPGRRLTILGKFSDSASTSRTRNGTRRANCISPDADRHDPRV